MARRTKRLWTDEEKRSICFQTTAAGVSVAQVARRYAMNANMIFKWLRDPWCAPDPEMTVDDVSADNSSFLPIEIVAYVSSSSTDLKWSQTNSPMKANISIFMIVSARSFISYSRSQISGPSKGKRPTTEPQTQMAVRQVQ